MNDPTNKHFWQRMAKIYAPFMKGSATLYDEIVRYCRPYLATDMNILELACGTGQLTFRLASCVRHWEATDFSEKMIEEAKKYSTLPNISFAVQDATALPYADGSFNAVLIANALHIMPVPEKALSEIHRVLKQDGILLAPTFIWGSDVRQRVREGLMTMTGFKVLHHWNADTLAEYVRQQNFSVLEQNVLGGSISPLCCLIARKA